MSTALTSCDSTQVLIGSVQGIVAIEGVPVAQASVRLMGDSALVRQTGTDGRFRFDVDAGVYHLDVSGLPADATFDQLSRPVTLAEPGQSVSVDVRGTWIRTSTISGVVRAGAEGLEGVTVSAEGPSFSETRSGTGGEFMLTGLRAGEYTVRIADYDEELYDFEAVTSSTAPGVDQQVEAAFEAALRPPYAPVALLAINGGPFQIELTWQDLSAHETEYRVDRRRAEHTWVEHVVLDAETESFTDHELLPGTSYSYRVRACNEIGCSEYGEAATERTQQVPPAPPTDLAATAEGPFSAMLTWQDDSSNEDSFEVERRTESTDWVRIADVDSDLETHQDSGLEPVTLYVYRLRACNEAGCSEFTDEAETLTADVPPSAPVDLTAAEEGPHRIRVGWTDGSDNEARFELNRRRTGQPGWVELSSVTADLTEIVDGDLLPGTQYDYRVRACNEVGCSTFSPVAGDRTEQIPPVLPTSLSATVVDPFTVALSWEDESPNESAFHVHRSDDGGTSWSEVHTTAADVEAWTDPSLAPDSQVRYQIEACNEVGCSGRTPTAVAQTPPIPPVPPSGMVATAVGAYQVDLIWSDDSDNEDDFRVERRSAPGDWAAIATVGPGSTSYSDSGLLPATSYEHRVRACNAGGCSSFSGASSATTDQAPPPAPTSLTATAAGADQIDLAWSYGGVNEDGLHVERRSGGGAWTEVTVLAPASLLYSDTGLGMGVTYDYRVRACNGVGCSDYTATASATTVAGPQDNLVISGVHITQTVQNVGGSIPLIRNLSGLLRVFVTTGVANSHQPSVRVRFYQGGSLVQTSTIAAPGASVPQAVDEGSLTSSWNLSLSGSLIQPGLEVLVDVDPTDVVAEANEADNTYPAGGSPAALDVRDPSPFSVVFVPVRQSVNGLEGSVGDPNGFFGTASRLFPINSMSGSVRSTYVTDAPVLQSGNGNSAWGTILSEVSALRAADGSSAAYYGVVKVDYGGGVAGIGFVGATVSLGWDKSSKAGIAAHEWGHNFGRRHAPCGGAGGPDPNFPHAGGRIGVFGYDRNSGALKDPAAYYDLMGYCGPDWISDYTYLGILGSRGSSSAPPAVAAAATSGLLLWGRIDRGGIVLEPAFDVDAPPTRIEPGPYRVVGVDASGATLFSVPFAGDELPDEVGGGLQFAFVVPTGSFDRSSLSAIRLEGPGVSVARSAPARAPGVAPIDPSAALEANGTVALTWDGASYPVALVRDASSGQIISFARGGSIRLSDGPTDLDVVLSDGVSTVRRRLTAR